MTRLKIKGQSRKIMNLLAAKALTVCSDNIDLLLGDEFLSVHCSVWLLCVWRSLGHMCQR